MHGARARARLGAGSCMESVPWGMWPRCGRQRGKQLLHAFISKDTNRVKNNNNIKQNRVTNYVGLEYFAVNSHVTS